MATAQVVTGERELIRELKRWEKQGGERLGRKVLGAALRSFAAGVKKSIPATTTPGRSTKRLKASVGYRVVRGHARKQVGKVGFRVGKGRANKAPHAHLFILGTKRRTRRRIGGRFARFDRVGARGTGKVEGHPDTVPRGVAASINKARSNMRRTGKREIEKQRKRRR